MARVLFHIDINAFFASVEEIKNPNLIGLPIGIGSNSRRSVLSTANYIAREYGVHAAMPVYEALRRCPDLILCEVDYESYEKMSRQFFRVLHQFTHKIEPASIDECYMDVTEIIVKYSRPLDLAYQIQQEVYEKTGLSVSIGVAPTKFLAKMASDMRKPKGITVLRKSELDVKLWPLSVDKIHGLGKKSVPLILKHNIQTIGDFADENNERLILSLLGKNAYSLILKTRGISTDQLEYSFTQKSVSASKTYTNDLSSIEEVREQAGILVRSLANKMKEDNQKGKIISLTLRDIHFHNTVRSFTFHAFTNDPSTMYEAINNLIDENYEEVGYRHLAVGMGSIKNENNIIEQPTLFESIQTNPTQDILERLNRNDQGITFKTASDLLKEKKK